MREIDERDNKSECGREKKKQKQMREKVTAQAMRDR